MDRTQDTSSGLSLTLFGPLQITLNGEPIVGLASDKIRGLLVFLAVEAGRPHRRNALGEMFWPDRPRGVARNNLKQAVSILRKALGDREAEAVYLLTTRDEIQFNSESTHWIDVDELDNILESCFNHDHKNGVSCVSCEESLKQACEMYRGQFLAEFSLSDSQAFEEWSLVNREVFQRRMANGFRELISLILARGEFEDACQFARRLVNLEPWNEENHRTLIRLLAQSGKRSTALKQYQVCQRILADEFGVETAAATKELYEAIREGTFETLVQRQPQVSPSQKELLITELISEEVQKPGKSRSFQPPSWLPLAVIIILVGIALYSWFGWKPPRLETTRIASQADGLTTVTQTTPIFQMETSLTEVEVLETFYKSTNGDQWENASGWISITSPCTWYGITCTAGSITELRLTNNHLTGSIPVELGNLFNLVVLDLEGNQLTGQIPRELKTLTHLSHLNLSFNRLSGEIPPELGEMQSLVQLSVAGNSTLSGPIPPELGNLQNLNELRLSSHDGGTQLSGPIPPELGKLTRLTRLDLANAFISGSIPPELGNLSNLLWIDLSNNPLEGTLPEELGNMANLRFFQIGEGPNQLHGPLPMSLMKLKKIELLQFHQTDICEPSDPQFQQWLEGIPEVISTDVVCAD